MSPAHINFFKKWRLGPLVYSKEGELMKITKSQLKQLIKEEIEEALSTESQDPHVKLLDLLEDILSEVQIDAGAYDEPRRSTETHRVRAQTAQNYLPELNAAVELLKSIIEKPAGASQIEDDPGQNPPAPAPVDPRARVDYTTMGSSHGTTSDVPRHGPSFLGTRGVSQRRRRK